MSNAIVKNVPGWNIAGKYGYPVILVVMIGFASFLLFKHTILVCPTLGYDEAYRAFEGARIHHDLISLDLVGFLKDTDRQRFWPFLYSWYLAAFYLPFGASVLVTRLAALAAYAGCLLSVYLAARQCDPERSGAAGVLAVWLFLANPEMARHAAGPMLEVPGLLLALLFLYSLNRYLLRPTPSTAAWTGVLLGLQVYLKYNFAAFSFLAGLIIFILAWKETRVSWKHPHLKLLAGLFLLMTLAWILPTFKGKMRAIFAFGVSVRYTDASFWSWDYLGYYLGQIFDKYSASMLVGVLFAAGMVYALFKWKDLCFRSYLIFALVVLGMATIHPQKAPRFGLSFAGLLPVFASLAIFDLVRWLPSRFPERFMRLTPLLVPLLMLLVLSPVWKTQAERNAWPRDFGQKDVLDWIVESCRDADSVWIAGAFEEISQPMINFALMTGLRQPVNLKGRDSMNVEHAPSLGVPLDETEIWLERSLIDLRAALEQRRYDRLISIRVESNSPFNAPYSLKYYALSQSYQDFLDQQDFYQELSRTRFHQPGIGVYVYHPSTIP